MPLSAAFCFFSPFHYKKKLLYQPFSPYISLFSLISLSSFISLFCQFSFIAYIRNLALYTIKNNKKLGDLIAKSPSPINTLYNRFY